MNNLLIEKLITLNNELCPEFVYTNPLLDKNVTKALSKSLIKTLEVSSQDSNINNSLRLTVLENIRKLCCDNPVNHLKIDDNVTELLIKLYEKHINKSFEDETADFVDRNLEKYFITNYKELNFNTTSKTSYNPEIIQALLNLDSKKHLEILCKLVNRWSFNDPKYYKLTKELWNNENYVEENLQNTICMNIKCEIEKTLLQVSQHVIKTKDTHFENIISMYDNFNNIINLCPRSSVCFQICCGILNYIFILSNFNLYVQKLIEGFVNVVKSLCKDNTIASIYPVHLTHVVVLLDIEICSIPSPHNELYILQTIEYLKKVCKEENDMIMLLSHFPIWFDVYFSK